MSEVFPRVTAHGRSIQLLEIGVYDIPTEQEESDGTLTWNSTTMVVVHLHAGGKTGLGFTYSHRATGVLIHETLSEIVLGSDPLAIGSVWCRVRDATRNLGRPGIVSSAMAAIDIALWDLKARLLDISVVDLIGPIRTEVEVYGSGGFTSYSRKRLCDQLAGWAERGIRRVKMKVGRHPNQDLERVKAAREAIGSETELFVDANGAYDRKQALSQAEGFASVGVGWFEEPVSSDDLSGLRLIRDRAPATMEITAGEYGYRLCYFERMLQAGAVDVLMADATRCSGFTGFLQVGSLCQARNLPMSAHTAPNLHCHVCCGSLPIRHLEYFHDHARIEQMLFDGALEPSRGRLMPDRSSPGMGLTFKRRDARQFLTWEGRRSSP